MLRITLPGGEDLWDEEKEEFIPVKEQVLQLEHSLVSISKWEAKWHKAFLGKQEKTTEEVIDYIKCMTVNQNVDPNAYYRLTNDDIQKINEYIENPMTATVISSVKNKRGGGGVRETLTSELIYYYMVAFNIPFECQKWHLNRLTTLINICDVKNTPPKKMSQRELMSRNSALNAARRKKLNTKG